MNTSISLPRSLVAALTCCLLTGGTISQATAQAYSISTLAGSNSSGYSGDGGPATSAKLTSPYGIAVDDAGNVYIADQYNHRVRKVSVSGTITTVAGTGTSGYSGDGGAAASARLNEPTGVAVDGAGNVYINDCANRRIRKVSVSGTITTIAGTGATGYSGDGGPATSAALNNPRDVAVDAAGNVYIADSNNNRIRKVSVGGTITTLAGTGATGYSGDGGLATSAGLTTPSGLAVDGAGNVYIADSGNNRIRKVSSTDGTITTFAGSFSGGNSGDGGPATSAALNYPQGIAVDGAGNVYISARDYHLVRKVSTDGTINTIAGTGTSGYSGDGGAATSAKLNYPSGLAVGTSGNVYIADYLNFVIRRLILSAPTALTINTGTLASPTAVPAGTYTTITVTGTGVAQLTGAVQATTAVDVQSGGTLLTNCQPLTGVGTFTLAAGATLGICDPAGITATGNTGAVQTAVRSFSPDANYLYNPTASIAFTGDALPATVRSLENRSTGNFLRMSQSLQVRQRLVLASGSFGPASNQTLTLLSDASGTALVVDAGGSAAGSGTNYIMQRYIGQNTGDSGYRQYSSPMDNESLSTLATTGYAPDFSGGAAYNSSATPGLVTPFPTVFSYEEGRTATASSNYSAFDKGWQAATASTDAMAVGRGYSVNAPGTALVDFQGRFTTGNVTLNNLTYTGPDGGWQLLGNPYPAPLDWSTMTSGPGQNLENMDAAVYVSQSTGPYAGTYRTYLAAAPGQNSPLIPAGSGFFVRTATPGVAGTVRFTNANRVTTFGAQPAFGRPTADLRPLVQLTLGSAAGPLADDLTVYADPAATTGLDAEYDAAKLPNGTGLNLSVVAATGQEQAIVGLPVLTAATVLPLHLQVPATGTYQLAATVANLPAGLTAYLRDLTTGQQVALGTPAPLTLAAGLNTRYALAFAQPSPLAATAGLTAAQVAVFPNPAAADAGVTVTLPVATGQQATAEVRDALGRLVLPARSLAMRGGQATGELPTAGLAPGVYVLRLTAGTTTVSKRLVIE